MEMNDKETKGRVSNSDGMCLLANWVEERQVRHIDEDSQLKSGHKGILSVNFDAGADNVTTVRESYKQPTPLGISGEGKRKQMMMKLLYEQISNDVQKSFYPEPEAADLKSETMEHFGGRFHGNPLLEDDDKTITCDAIYNEQPVSFWTENQNRITGVSQVKTGDSPFRKNDAFSRPIDEYRNEPQPGDIENYPKM